MTSNKLATKEKIYQKQFRALLKDNVSTFLGAWDCQQEEACDVMAICPLNIYYAHLLQPSLLLLISQMGTRVRVVERETR